MFLSKLRLNMWFLSKRKDLLRHLHFIESQIENQQSLCQHMGVVLGYTGSYPSKETGFVQCLFCGKENPNSEISVFPISAISYLQEMYHDGSTEMEREGRLVALQNLWICLAEQYPEATMEELMDKFKEEIKKDEIKHKIMEKKLDFTS